MRQTGKFNKVVREMREYKLDILGLSEVRWENFGTVTTKDGFTTLLYSGVPHGSIHQNGVGLLIKKEIHRSLMSWYPVIERLRVVRFQGQVRNVTIIQCYAPTEPSEVEKKIQFYIDLRQILEKTHRSDIIIIKRDLNVKVGTDNRCLQHRYYGSAWFGRNG